MKRIIPTLAIVAAMTICVVVVHAKAQDIEPQDMGISRALGLARTMVREAGTAAYRRDDGTAIDAVIRFRSTFLYRSNYLEGLRRFTHGAPVSTTHNRRWITELFPDGPEPSTYPRHLRWVGRGEVHWRRTYSYAVDVIEGARSHICNMEPHTWGDANDARRYRSANPSAVELDCGQTCTLDRDGEVRLLPNGLPKCNYFFHHPMYSRLGLLAR